PFRRAGLAHGRPMRAHDVAVVPGQRHSQTRDPTPAGGLTESRLLVRPPPVELAGEAFGPGAGVADRQEEGALGGSVQDLPEVVAVEGLLVSLHLALIRLDGEDVRLAGVVVKERAAHVAAAAVGVEETGSRHDRIAL